MLHTDGPWFKDQHNRTLILRGINLGGSSKVPATPNGATHIREGFFEHRDVSFVGRPFPLDEADEHFSRLRAWGYTFLRFLITWEAIEHAGPGIYDEAYLDYLQTVVKMAGEYGFTLFIDPHQDVWSRFSGGDGAPGWTFEAVGLDIMRFAETGAAIVHATHEGPYPQMIWPTNADKLAAATMFTLFFGGDDFAPQTTIAGESAQSYLQRHYIDAIKQVALRLKGMPHVVGYDTLNEPMRGYIGCESLENRAGLLSLGESPTIIQSMASGAGIPQEVGIWEVQMTGFRQTGTHTLNPNGVSAWLEGHPPIWQHNGVWDVGPGGQPRILRPDHFARVGDRKVDFNRDYLRPFANRFAREIREIDPPAIIFVETTPMEHTLHWGLADAPDIVDATHWYDNITLFTKNFIPWLSVDHVQMRPVLGKRAVRQLFIEQLAAIKRNARENMGDVPTLIGEFGIPFDMRERASYQTGDYTRQIQALDTTFQALEANLLSGTLWNYTADNSNAHGDQWNEEDLSIFSRDQQKGTDDPHDGGRALEAAVRPYARAVAGEPLHMAFSAESRVFEIEFRHDEAITAPTELFVPNFQYPEGYVVEISDGEYAIDRESQTLIYRHTPGQDTHWLRLWDARLPVPLTEHEKRKRQLRMMAVAGGVLGAGLVAWHLLTHKEDEES